VQRSQDELARGRPDSVGIELQWVSGVIRAETGNAASCHTFRHGFATHRPAVRDRPSDGREDDSAESPSGDGYPPLDRLGPARPYSRPNVFFDASTGFGRPLVASHQSGVGSARLKDR
jgi:hypothetical protein